MKVFQMNSRNENMILKLATDDDAATADAETVARQLIGRSVYAGWPHMCEVRVTAVSDGAFKYSLCESSKPARGGGGHKVKIDIQEQELDRNEATAWCREAEGIQDRCVSVTRLCRVTLGSLIYSVPCSALHLKRLVSDFAPGTRTAEESRLVSPTFCSTLHRSPAAGRPCAYYVKLCLQ